MNCDFYSVEEWNISMDGDRIGFVIEQGRSRHVGKSKNFLKP
jgi:hypothetical protein